jgi:hypothetical protein
VKPDADGVRVQSADCTVKEEECECEYECDESRGAESAGLAVLYAKSALSSR